MAIIIFIIFVLFVIGLSLYLGSKTKTSSGYYAAGGKIHWGVNGVAFAGDYLSAASFLGICGLIATVGYDGFLYSIGYLAGWIVALFVVAEPLKRLGKYTFTDAVDANYNSRGIKLTAAISTLVVSICYLIPQMVGAGVLVEPLLGIPSFLGCADGGSNRNNDCCHRRYGLYNLCSVSKRLFVDYLFLCFGRRGLNSWSFHSARSGWKSSVL
jgi:cation/acetate symporter